MFATAVSAFKFDGLGHLGFPIAVETHLVSLVAAAFFVPHETEVTATTGRTLLQFLVVFACDATLDGRRESALCVC